MYRNDTPSIGTPIHDLHSKFAKAAFRCIYLVLRHRRTKGGGLKPLPLMLLGKQIRHHRKSRCYLYFIRQAVEEDGVSKRYTIEDSVKHGLVNHIPESGIRFCIVKSRGDSPPHQTSAPNQCVGFGYWEVNQRYFNASSINS